MKKIISLVLCFVLSIGISLPVFATADNSYTETWSIEGVEYTKTYFENDEEIIVISEGGGSSSKSILNKLTGDLNVYINENNTRSYSSPIITLNITGSQT